MIEQDIIKLEKKFPKLNWDFKEEEIKGKKEIVSYWPGNDEEEIMVCVLKSDYFSEVFHRQDFFFINFAYANDYEALSVNSDNKITIRENDCYVGQPYSGYALKGNNKEKGDDIIIIGILIKKNLFFREFLPSISMNNQLFHFLVDPQNDTFSDNFIHVSFNHNHPVRKLIELAVSEYANKSENTSEIIKLLTLTILMYLIKEYQLQERDDLELTLTDRIIQFIRMNLKCVNLNKIAQKFSYHPNYVSNLLREKTGKTFSQILLEERMKRASLLLKRTDLSVEEIASMIGYSCSSNFYKAFKAYYNKSPREFLLSETEI